MRQPADPNSRIVGFRLDHGLHKRLKMLCVAHEMSLQEAFTQAILQWLAADASYKKVPSLHGEQVAAGYTQPGTAPGTRP